MGTSCSWYIIRGKAREAVLRELGLRDAGKQSRNSPYGGTLRPNGWFVIFHGRHEYEDAEAKHLSEGCDLIACFLEEHVMVSKSAGWKDGKEIWSVMHNPDEGLFHLEIQGDPPAALAAIRERITQKQEMEGDSCDCTIEIPMALAAAITGYDHENDDDVEFDTYVKPTLIQRMFGKS